MEREAQDSLEIIQKYLVEEYAHRAEEHKQAVVRRLGVNDFDGVQKEARLASQSMEIAQGAAGIIERARQELAQLGIISVPFEAIDRYSKRQGATSEPLIEPPVFHPQLPVKDREVLASQPQTRLSKQLELAYQFIRSAGPQGVQRQDLANYLQSQGYKTNEKSVSTILDDLKKAPYLSTLGIALHGPGRGRSGIPYRFEPVVPLSGQPEEITLMPDISGVEEAPAQELPEVPSEEEEKK